MVMVEQTRRGGLFDWIVQRCTAVVVGGYAIFIMIYLLAHPALNYASWHGLYANMEMRVATILVLLSILWHAWIGLWTVFTDYVKFKPLRLILEIGVIFLLLSYFIALFEILWR